MFLPDNPSLNSPNFSKSVLVKCFAYRLKIAPLDNLSGNSNFTLKSIRLNMAGSKSCFLLVAQINNTSVELSKLSIFLNKVDKIRLLAS